MSQHGREFEKQGFSYMDGVPVKISEKYKPPKKYNLPVGFLQKLPTETITEEYDFQLERSVLEKINQWRKIRSDAIETRRKRIEADEKIQQEKAEKLKELAIGSPTAADNSAEDANTTQSSDNVCKADSPEKAPLNSADVPSADSASVQLSEEVINGQKSVVSAQGRMIPAQSNQYAIPNSILTPTPYGPFMNQKKDYQQSPFNLSDFEADTSSPFDNMELKTINDMEELAHVLQPMSSSVKAKDSAGSQPLHFSYYAPNMPVQPSSAQVSNSISSVHQLVNSDMKPIPQVNGITSYSLYGTVPRTQMQPGSQMKSSDLHNIPYGAFDSRNYPYPVSSMQNSSFVRGSVYDYYCGHPWEPKTAVVSTNGMRISQGFPISKENTSVSGSSSATTGGPSYSGPVENMDNNNMYPFPPTSYFNPQVIASHAIIDKAVAMTSSESGGLRASKSVPDIMKELESELNKQPALQRRYNCNATPTGQSIPKELENWSPWPTLDSPDNSPHSPPGVSLSKPDSGNSKEASSKYTSSLPNPFHELTPSAQRLVEHISEMGFSLARVARACQMFGEDDKKIVEFLLQVQSLEEKCYPGDLVEQSLISSNYNEEECVNYLKLVAQLKDLGFSESQVIQALKITENDGDKALDYLVS
ncbi:ubiquitin-associated protein 1 [Ischnura elegans]|uniref:ubiquitin-associated protein 1 n=1 Tax=Ischnura elegans TaxID=197161 RepID=UPI001ED8A307|nr:ubiquitin-associated protein 1 [Ischnura elegans]